MKKNIFIMGFLILFLFSFSVNGLNLDKNKDDFNLTKNLIKDDIILNVDNVDLEFSKIKVNKSIKMETKLLNNDENINSYVYDCVRTDYNLNCKVQMQHDYIVWFDDMFTGKINASYYLKKGNDYIINFENVLYGKLHIGEHSDISFIGEEPVFYYFPTANNDTVIDESESINYDELNATLINNATVYSNESQLNAHFLLNGINQYAQILSSDSLDIYDDITFLAWIKRNHTGTYDTVISTGGYVLGGSDKHMIFVILNDDRIQFVLESDVTIGVTTANTITTQKYLDTFNYHQIGFVYDYNLARGTIFLDGEAIHDYDLQQDGDVNTLQGNYNNYIGRFSYTDTLHFSGEISNVLWINDSLSDLEIETIYNFSRKNYYINNTPIATIETPFNNSIVSNLTLITYSCTDVDLDGNYSELYINGNLELNTTFYNTNFSFDFSSFSSGSYEILLICVDNDNLKGNYSINVGITGDIIQEQQAVDLKETNKLILLSILAFIYIGLLIVGMFTQSLSVLIGAIIMGIFTGIELGYKYSATMGLIFIFINVLFMITIIKEAKKD